MRELQIKPILVRIFQELLPINFNVINPKLQMIRSTLPYCIIDILISGVRGTDWESGWMRGQVGHDETHISAEYEVARRHVIILPHKSDSILTITFYERKTQKLLDLFHYLPRHDPPDNGLKYIFRNLAFKFFKFAYKPMKLFSCPSLGIDLDPNY